jgi:hypothetical protein
MWDCLWPVGKAFHAQCLQVHSHCLEPPRRRCRCGIYAVHGPKQVLAAVGLEKTRALVVGEVSLWGRVVVARRGWRAEWAYPKRLFVIQGETDEEADLVEGLETYGIPVNAASWGEVMSHPPTVPEKPSVWHRLRELLQ